MNDRSVLFAVYGQHGKNTLEKDKEYLLFNKKN